MKTNHGPTDYRAVLTQELLRRIEENPAYSLRRFAQQLDVSPATLSGVLAGKRRLSLKTAARMGEKLNLNPAEAAKFCQAVAASLTGQEMSSAPVSEFVTLSEDVFQVMADWYYFAILELTFVKGFQNDVRWIARKLGLNRAQAADAIERLKKLGLLETRGTTLVKTTARIALSSGTPSVAIRRRHKQILQKAIDSLETVPFKERDFSSMTMAIDPALLPEAIERISAFRRELCVWLESGTQKRVYEFSMQLFPLSEGERK